MGWVFLSGLVVVVHHRHHRRQGFLDFLGFLRWLFRSVEVSLDRRLVCYFPIFSEFLVEGWASLSRQDWDFVASVLILLLDREIGSHPT